MHRRADYKRSEGFVKGHEQAIHDGLIVPALLPLPAPAATDVV